MTLNDLHAQLSTCRRCADAGYFIGSTPISTLNAGAVFMTVGQAPGRHEAEVTHLPFSGPAGRRLFRWLAQAGFDEADFRATQAMVAITRCYPGPHPGGRGDRVPSRAEQALCAPWLEAELALIQPRVLIPIGGLAIGCFLKSPPVMLNGATPQPTGQQNTSEASRWGSCAGDSPGVTLSRKPAAHEVPARDVSLTNRRNGPCIADPLNMTSGTSLDYPHAAARLGSTQDDSRKSLKMTDLIGERFERDGDAGSASVIIVPLPHPSGASQWFNVPENKMRLARALEILAQLRRELLH